MIFSELYSAYYLAVAAVLKEACTHLVSRSELREIVSRHAFGESLLTIEPALLDGRWQLLREDGTTPILHTPSMPMTHLQKRWLKAVSLDPRIRLFYDTPPDFPDVEPLFTPEDILVFDRFNDGDPFEDEAYIRNFRMILDAVRTRTPLSIYCLNRKGNPRNRKVIPEMLEYSEKDDKFRLISSGTRNGNIINLARIIRCTPIPDAFADRPARSLYTESRTVVLEVYDERRAMERVLLHFAHFRKEAEKLDHDRYRITISYDKDDETEMVIRILSFGPLVKVLSPDSFVQLIRERLLQQKKAFSD